MVAAIEAFDRAHPAAPVFRAFNARQPEFVDADIDGLLGRPPSTEPSMPLPSTLTTVASGSARCFCNSSSDAIVRLKSQHQNRMMICQAFRQLESDPQVQKPISVVWSVDGADIDPGVLNFEEESADAGRRTAVQW